MRRGSKMIAANCPDCVSGDFEWRGGTVVPFSNVVGQGFVGVFEKWVCLRCGREWSQ